MSRGDFFLLIFLLMNLRPTESRSNKKKAYIYSNDSDDDGIWTDAFFFFFLDLKINKKPRGLPTPYSCGFFFFFFFGVRDPFFFPRGPIVWPDGTATRRKINGRTGWWVKLALYLPQHKHNSYERNISNREAGTQSSSSSLEDAKKRQRIDDFLYPFQVPSDFLFPTWLTISPLVCIIPRSEEKKVAFTPCLISRWPGHPEDSLSGEKKKKKQPNLRRMSSGGGTRRRKRNEKEKKK